MVYVSIRGEENYLAIIPANVGNRDWYVSLTRHRRQLRVFLVRDCAQNIGFAFANCDHHLDVLEHGTMLGSVKLIPMHHASVKPSALASVFVSKKGWG